MAVLESGKLNVGGAIAAAFKKDRQINDSTLIMGNYNEYTDAQRRELLDGVERIAAGKQGDRLTSMYARVEAFAVLYAVGREPGLNEIYQIPDRLLRIYDHAMTDEAKRAAVRALGRILRSSPTATPRVVKLLISLVNQPVVTQQRGYHGTVQVVAGPVHPDVALDALLMACEAGVPGLHQLAANLAAVKHDVVRARVDSIARGGFVPGRTRLASDGSDPCTPDR